MMNFTQFLIEQQRITYFLHIIVEWDGVDTYIDHVYLDEVDRGFREQVAMYTEGWNKWDVIQRTGAMVVFADFDGDPAGEPDDDEDDDPTDPSVFQLIVVSRKKLTEEIVEKFKGMAVDLCGDYVNGER